MSKIQLDKKHKVKLNMDGIIDSLPLTHAIFNQCE